MVFASHQACFPLGAGKKKEQLKTEQKTIQAFFKHPFLKLSFFIVFPPNFLGQVLPALHTVSDKMQMSNIISSVA